MTPIVLFVALTLVVAVVVLGAAMWFSGSNLVADLRSGLRRDEPRLGVLAAARHEHAQNAGAESGTLEDLLR